MLKLEHDFHVHTHLSSCAKDSATIAHYVAKARELGIKKLGLADHMWDAAIPGASKWYSVQDFAHISTIREEIAAVEHEGIEFLIGAEGEYDYAHRGIALSEAVAEQLDFLIVPNSHTHMTMPKDFYEPHRKHAEFMLDAFYDIINSPLSKYVTAIPHPFMAVCCPYPNAQAIAEFDAPMEAMVKLRYRSRACPCIMEFDGKSRVIARLTEPQQATAPGQYAVFYCGSTVVGGGVIEEVC
jgi:histidinol phosphatase-like PHP family hydrolase